MKYGLDDEEIRLLEEIFASIKGLDRVILYGSRAKDNYKPFSDIDITLDGHDLTEEDLTEVQYRLSESSLPYFCDVSLLSKLTSPSLLDHIRRKGKTLYQRAA